jgi:hypothetical protein
VKSRWLISKTSRCKCKPRLRKACRFNNFHLTWTSVIVKLPATLGYTQGASSWHETFSNSLAFIDLLAFRKLSPNWEERWNKGRHYWDRSPSYPELDCLRIIPVSFDAVRCLFPERRTLIQVSSWIYCCWTNDQISLKGDLFEIVIRPLQNCSQLQLIDQTKCSTRELPSSFPTSDEIIVQSGGAWSWNTVIFCGRN